MNIFEINQSIKRVKDMDLDPEVLADTLESLELSRDEKLDGVASWIESNNSKIDWLASKIKQLQEVKSRLSKQNDRLNDFLTKAIDDAGLKSLQTKNHILKPRNYRASVVADDPEQLPVDYVISKTTYSADKKKLYEDLKAGKQIKGAYLKENRKVVIE